MDGTEEGLKVAAATREAAQKKRAAGSEPVKTAPPPAKRKGTVLKQQPTCTHEVAIPKGFDEAAHAKKFDPTLSGELRCAVKAGTQAAQFRRHYGIRSRTHVHPGRDTEPRHNS